MGSLITLVLYISSFFLCGGALYKLFSFLVKTQKPKPDFDPIDCRNETRFLRYHYPEDKP